MTVFDIKNLMSMLFTQQHKEMDKVKHCMCIPHAMMKNYAEAHVFIGGLLQMPLS